MLTSPYCASSLVTALSRVTKGIAQGRERGGVDSPVQIYTMAISENVVFFFGLAGGYDGRHEVSRNQGCGVHLDLCAVWTLCGYLGGGGGGTGLGVGRAAAARDLREGGQLHEPGVPAVSRAFLPAAPGPQAPGPGWG